jgi:hypothetical protein
MPTDSMWQVHVEVGRVLGGLIAIFTGDFLENTLSRTLDDSTGRPWLRGVIPILHWCAHLLFQDKTPQGTIAVTGAATLLAFLAMALLAVEQTRAALVTSLVLLAEMLAVMLWFITLSGSEELGSRTEIKTFGWSTVGLSTLFVTHLWFVDRKQRQGQLVHKKDLSTNNWREWHAEILRVITAASQIFTVYLFGTAIADLLDGDRLSYTKRIGFCAISSLVLVLEVTTDALASIPRYFSAFGFAAFKVALVLGSVVYTNINIHDWRQSTIVFVYVVLVLSGVVAVYLFVLRTWHVVVKRRRKANNNNNTVPLEPLAGHETLVSADSTAAAATMTTNQMSTSHDNTSLSKSLSMAETHIAPPSDPSRPTADQQHPLDGDDELQEMETPSNSPTTSNGVGSHDRRASDA